MANSFSCSLMSSFGWCTIEEFSTHRDWRMLALQIRHQALILLEALYHSVEGGFWCFCWLVPCKKTQYLVLHSPYYDLPASIEQAHYQMLGKVRRQATGALSMSVVISLFHSTNKDSHVTVPRYSKIGSEMVYNFPGGGCPLDYVAYAACIHTHLDT